MLTAGNLCDIFADIFAAHLSPQVTTTSATRDTPRWVSLYCVEM